MRKHTTSKECLQKEEGIALYFEESGIEKNAEKPQ